MTSNIVPANIDSRYATRVRINAPQGSMFNGCEGKVIRIKGNTLLIRLQYHRQSLTIPFGISEVEVLP